MVACAPGVVHAEQVPYGVTAMQEAKSPGTTTVHSSLGSSQHWDCQMVHAPEVLKSPVVFLQGLGVSTSLTGHALMELSLLEQEASAGFRQMSCFPLSPTQ